MTFPRQHVRLTLLATIWIAGTWIMGSGCTKQVPRVQVVYSSHPIAEKGIRAFTRDGLLLEKFDLNEDGELDSWNYSQPLDKHDQPIPKDKLSDYTPRTVPQKRLVQRKLDINFDGKVDLVRDYDENGDLAKDEMDSNYDGVMDRIIYYTDGRITRRLIDADEDGTYEEVRNYIDGKLYRVERDTNHSGKPNFWMFFEDGKLQRAGVDLDGDGVIDRWLVTEELDQEQHELDASEKEENARTMPEP